jgi:hypothetical protein
MNDMYTRAKCDSLIMFLEAFIHCALYVTGLYPSAIFSRLTYCDVPVHISTDHRLCTYIANFLERVRAYLPQVRGVARGRAPTPSPPAGRPPPRATCRVGHDC